jgi:thiamine pyrophosphate-dependent acetolactate synthase large subunit-like protein
VKWDDQPTSGPALVEAMLRANMITRAAPTAPVYVCLDAGFQETKLDKEPEIPDVKRYQPPAAPRPSKEALDQAVALLKGAKKPLILLGRGSRRDEFWQPRIRLAEKLGAVVFTDLKQGAMFPSDNPHHFTEPFNAIVKEAREVMCEADVILSLDWMDLGGALRQAKNVGTVTAKIINCTLDQNLHNGANMEYQEMPPSDVFSATTTDVMVAELNAALGEGKKDPWKARLVKKKKDANGALTMEVIAQSLRDQFNDPENVTFCTLGRGWPTDIWPLHSGMSYLGKDGGGGLGSGPGISVGSALALHHKFPDRYAITMLGDGDFCMGVSAIWTAVKHQIPLLVIVNNNRSYFNDELHQEHVARDRGREPKNRWIGLRMEDPLPSIAKFAEAQGAVGIGPITSQADAKAAIAKGVDVLKKGGVCVIDFHVEPPAERQANHGLGFRATTTK